MRHEMLDNIPPEVHKRAQEWSEKFIADNPNWQTDPDIYEDDWDYIGDYDLNLYCETGYLSVTVYATREDPDRPGYVCADYEYFEYLVRLGKGN